MHPRFADLMAAPNDTLTALRGSLAPARANARSIAALTENPGCQRRRVIDAAGVRAFELAAKLGHAMPRGQSPFAIATGHQFEKQLKAGSEYRQLVEAIAPFVTFPEALRVVDLGKSTVTGPIDIALRTRAQKTEEVLAKIARGDDDAAHIVDHPVLVFDIGGAPAFLEPDAIAFRVGEHLEVVEIKSYPVIDGQADPAKLSATAGQAAVYLLALRATLARLGFDPALVHPSVILVAPRNFGRTPSAHRVPIKKKMLALERVLRRLPRTDDILKSLDLPAGFTLDSPRRDDLDHAVRRLPMLYVPECLSSCDMGDYCRHQAIVDDDPSRLGRAARDSLAGVPKLRDALRLATEGALPEEAHLQDIASTLQQAYRALSRARAAASNGGAP